MEEDRLRHSFFFRNKSPKPDEPATYRPPDAKDGDTYADIALLPNLDRTGYVLILSGIDMAGTEAAGGLVASPEFSDLLAKMLRPVDGSAPASYIEMLMQAKAVAGTTEAPRIVAYRLLPGTSISAASHAACSAPVVGQPQWWSAKADELGRLPVVAAAIDREAEVRSSCEPGRIPDSGRGVIGDRRERPGHTGSTDAHRGIALGLRPGREDQEDGEDG